MSVWLCVCLYVSLLSFTCLSACLSVCLCLCLSLSLSLYPSLSVCLLVCRFIVCLFYFVLLFFLQFLTYVQSCNCFLLTQISNLLQTVLLLLPLLLTRIGHHLNFRNFRSFYTGLFGSWAVLQTVCSMYISQSTEWANTAQNTMSNILCQFWSGLFLFYVNQLVKTMTASVLHYLSCAIFSSRLFNFLEQTCHYDLSFYSPKRNRMCLLISSWVPLPAADLLSTGLSQRNSILTDLTMKNNWRGI